jgi:hypothetical protein
MKNANNKIGRPSVEKSTYCVRLNERVAGKLRSHDPQGKGSLSRGIESLASEDGASQSREGVLQAHPQPDS